MAGVVVIEKKLVIVTISKIYVAVFLQTQIIRWSLLRTQCYNSCNKPQGTEGEPLGKVADGNLNSFSFFKKRTSFSA